MLLLRVAHGLVTPLGGGMHRPTLREDAANIAHPQDDACAKSW